MNEYTTKLGEDGRIVVPAFFRKQLHLAPGDQLLIRLTNEGLFLSTLKQSLKNAQAIVRARAKSKSLVKMLHQQRKKDTRNE